uniref:Tetratricopeptide repeat protein n=1 Tax=Acrobeloides nanus TaxID=290746 RepID=A0A914CFG9_9BILA
MTPVGLSTTAPKEKCPLQTTAPFDNCPRGKLPQWITVPYGSKAKNVVIRVDSPSDVLFVYETDEKLLSQANALQWFKQETYSFEEIKDQAKTLFMKKDYEGSLKLYQRALALQPESEVIHLNVACVLLQFEQKTLYRLGKAAYGMRMWQQAIDHYETLLTESSRVPIAAEELTKSKTRLNESLTGQYDMLTDYTGPVEVTDIPGKGKGLVVTQDIKKGTLLFASKAYSMAHEKFMNYPKSQGYNLFTDEVICNTQFGLITETVQKLKRDPGSAKELYALYAGELKRDEMLPNGVIDAGRIEQICSLNDRE